MTTQFFYETELTTFLEGNSPSRSSSGVCQGDFESGLKFDLEAFHSETNTCKKPSFIEKWGKNRFFKLMRGVASFILVILIFSVYILIPVSNQEPVLPKDKSIGIKSDTYGAGHSVIEFKTNCFPRSEQYSRKRRDLNFSAQSLPHDILKLNGSDEVIVWRETNTYQPLNQTKNYRPFQRTLGEIRSPRRRIGQTDLRDKLESVLKRIDNRAKNDLGNEKQEPSWDKIETEEGKTNGGKKMCDLITEEGPGIQYAFWKGEGDMRTIRINQGKLMKQYMDMCTDPCQDFYQHACGRWSKLNPIPRDKGAFDTFEMLRESLDTVLKELLEEQNLATDTQAYIKARNLYRSCVNYDVVEKRGASPLLSLLKKLGDWPMITPTWNETDFDWLWLMANLRLFNNDVLISEWVGPDIKNSDEYVIHLDQTSLGLPTRDYYLQPANLIYLQAYTDYLARVASLLGACPENVTKDAQETINFETSLAKITSSPDERRNVSELYQRMTVGELRNYVPQIDWTRYLTIVLGRPVNITENVVVFALRYLEDLVSLLGRTPSRTVANYLFWRFVRHRVNNLDDRFQDAKQKFYFILFGREESPPRWKSCVAQVNSNMGMAMGAMFVKKYFDEYSKNDTLIMTREIQQAFREILNFTDWIDNDTKLLAREKVDAMTLKIGYPDSILISEHLNDKYKDVDIDAGYYFENTVNILRHLAKIEQSHLGNPVNKSIWNTAPAIVNAYYSRNKNQIMFPAGILQPPFYHRYFPKSLNYGGIGVVIGHEITHGFDDKGRLFDKKGNLHRWWRDEAINNFHERAQCIIDQYSKYVVDEVGIQVNGESTQGENIADNGGIKQSFRAYKKWLVKNGDIDETLPGLNYTGTQLFFLNFAQVWCGDTRPAATRNKMKTAVHSPGKYRVIGTLSNSEDFAKVYNCPLGSPMNPVKKCSVW